MTSKQKTYIVELEKANWNVLGQFITGLFLVALGIGGLSQINHESIILFLCSLANIWLGVYIMIDSFTESPTKTVEKEVKLKEVKNGRRKS